MATQKLMQVGGCQRVARAARAAGATAMAIVAAEARAIVAERKKAPS